MTVTSLFGRYFFMKTRDKIIISVVAGLLAMMLHAVPMWWGVLFSPISRPLVCESITEETKGGFYWQSDGVILRFRSLDLLLSFLHSS